MIETAGIILFRRSIGAEVLLVHIGGPFWASKHKNAWTIPKGIVGRDEEPLAAARREFFEETGSPPNGDAVFLRRYRQNSKKNLSVWMMEGDFDPSALKCNTFRMIWPPNSGQAQTFPEVDRAEWFNQDAALRNVVLGQAQAITDCFARLDEMARDGRRRSKLTQIPIK